MMESEANTLYSTIIIVVSFVTIFFLLSDCRENKKKKQRLNRKQKESMVCYIDSENINFAEKKCKGLDGKFYSYDEISEDLFANEPHIRIHYSREGEINRVLYLTKSFKMNSVA